APGPAAGRPEHPPRGGNGGPPVGKPAKALGGVARRTRGGGGGGRGGGPARFADAGNQDLVRRLVEAGVNSKADGDTGAELPQTLAGMSFVLTGGLGCLTRAWATPAIDV